MRPLINKGLFVFLVLVGVLCLGGISAQAFAQTTTGQTTTDETDAAFLPPALKDLQEVQPENPGFKKSEMAIEIRKEAQREAALSYGARGGLSKRTFEIRQALNAKERYLDKVFDFRRLLLRAPSGLLMEPPIIDEATNNLIIDTMGQEAAVADVIYNIDQPAKIVTTSRNWRTYLEREWGDVPPPPDVLLPENYEERVNWRNWVERGWKEGYAQAEEIFQTDLDRLVADFVGMVRYRMLLAQGMVSEPFAYHENRGITGGGSELRIGDRNVRITGPSQLKPGGETWQPADR